MVANLVQWLAGRLRYPQLFLLTASLFLLDLVIPDMIPFVDELLLGLATLWLASLRRRKEDGRPRDRRAPPPVRRVIDVKPEK